MMQLFPIFSCALKNLNQVAGKGGAPNPYALPEIMGRGPVHQDITDIVKLQPIVLGNVLQAMKGGVTQSSSA